MDHKEAPVVPPLVQSLAPKDIIDVGCPSGCVLLLLVNE